MVEKISAMHYINKCPPLVKEIPNLNVKCVSISFNEHFKNEL